MTRTPQPSATETIALDAMRDAIAGGWTTEALMVDAAAQALVKSGLHPFTAETVAQIVWNKHRRIMGAV